MPRLSAEKITKKQVENASRSTEAYKDGVSNPRRGAATAALAASAKRAEAVRVAEEGKYWEKSMAKVTDDYVKKRAVDIGAPRYAPGIKGAEEKTLKFWRGWKPILDGIEGEVAAMPDVTDADREARMIANVRALKAKKGDW